MTWHRMTVGLLLVAAATGCGKAPFGKKEKGKAPTAKTGAVTPGPAPAAPAPAPTPTATTPPKPAPRIATAAAPAGAVQEAPWTPTDTGAVSPGMTRDAVVAVWGKPVIERQRDRHTYLYYRNGCEGSCGTFDVVLLDGGQVVDAVVRGPGHTYTGVSSSPAGRAPLNNAPKGAAPPSGATA